MGYPQKWKGVTRRDRLRNDIIRTQLKTNSIQDFIEQKQLSWWDHLQRKTEDVPIKKV